MLRNQKNLAQSVVMIESSNDNMRAIDSDDYSEIHPLEEGDGDDAADTREGSVKLVAAELAQERVQEREEASTQDQDEQIIGIHNKEFYEQMIVKMEAENKYLQYKLNRQHKKISILQHELYEPKSRSDYVLMRDLAQSSPQVKNEVIHLIIDEYVSTSSPDKLSEKLDSAFEAIDFMYTDGEPVQVKGFPFLYVGSVGASLNGKSLIAHNITHVVNWSSTARCNVFDGIEYHCIEGLRGKADMSRMKNVKKLRDAVEFVEMARIAGGNVMSHCWYGRNRSVTLLVAYLMKYAGMGIDEATALIAETRPQADPYVGALALYKKYYLDA